MKKKTILALSVLLAIALLAAGSLYKRPVKLAQLYPDLDFDACTGILASYAVNDSTQSRSAKPVFFPSDSEGFRLLMQGLTQQRYQKSFRNFLPGGEKTHLPAPGEFQWELALTFNAPVSMPDGSTGHGSLLRVTHFYGALAIEGIGGDKPVRCSAENQQQWAEAMLSVITSGTSAQTAPAR